MEAKFALVHGLIRLAHESVNGEYRCRTFTLERAVTVR
jgi:hypothetical protein